MFAKDKILHIVVGCIITIIGVYFLSFWGIMLAIAAAIGKEIWDVHRKKLPQFNMADLIASGAGIIIGSLIATIFI